MKINISIEVNIMTKIKEYEKIKISAWEKYEKIKNLALNEYINKTG